jgi:hypothetical protein
MGDVPTIATPKGADKVDLSEMSDRQLNSAVKLLAYPGIELVPAPELPPKEGFHQELIVGWTSDAVETVLAHFKQKLADSGFTLETQATVGESVGTVMAQKPDGTGSVEVNVGRKEGGKTHVMVQFDAPK